MEERVNEDPEVFARRTTLADGRYMIFFTFGKPFSDAPSDEVTDTAPESENV